MGRKAKKSRKRVKNNAHGVAPRIAAKPKTKLAHSEEPLLGVQPEDAADRRRRLLLLRDRVYEARDLAKKKYPDLDTEAFIKELGAQFKRRLDQLEKKHPETDRLQLALYLTMPLDEQPLWFNPGQGEAMSQEERVKVINEFVSQARKSGLPPSLMTRGSLVYRALKRQTRLTFKQWQVARLTVAGYDNKVIAGRLSISERMVKTYLQAIRRKARLTRNAEIVRWFLGY